MALALRLCASVHGFRLVTAGTGLADRSAACELARAGVAVTLLDVRPHTGGRVVRTIREFAAQQHGGPGGEFIDGDERSGIRSRVAIAACAPGRSS